MNDRFRFRVWDIEFKKYYPASDFCVEDLQDSGDEIIVEQCTGLEDENGKLIFEGDKVRMTEFYFDGFGESERNFVGYVMWNKGEFVLSKNPEKPEYENETEIIPHISWGHSFEIIGNIHEVEE